MLETRLEDLQEVDLLKLIKDETPEGLRLEFKESLDLNQRDQKRELAKDVSGMANSAGGRILYGIVERELSDGSKVAGAVKALTDGAIAERLASIIVDAVQPRPQFRTQKVTATDGFVLVVEVYDSSGRDLHMVAAYGEQRFYRRTDRSVVPMTEPEIREAYRRIAMSTIGLEESLEAAITEEFRLRAAAQESVLIAPWYARRNLANPPLLYKLRGVLADGPLKDFDHDCDSCIRNMRVFSGGLRAFSPYDKAPEQATTYFAITRAGIVHISESRVIYDASYELRRTLRTISAAIRAAQLIYDTIAYWGPVRIVHRLALPSEVFPYPADTHRPWPPGEHRSVAGEVNLRALGAEIDLVLREILDELFQVSGHVRCPWFDEGGRLKAELRSLVH